MDLIFGAVPTRESVRTYAYHAPPLSLCERLFLDRFWSALPGHIYPRWLAPNVITMGGLGAAASAAALVLRRSPAMDASAPRWCYGAAAGLLWVYQTLDGSDGKQARATRSGSALGELMDHGVDALTTVFVTAASMDLAGYGARDWRTWVPVLTSCGGFFLSNLVLIHKGVQDFFDLDIQELLLWTQASFALAAWRGPAFLRSTVGGVELRAVLAAVGSGGAACNCVVHLRSALAARRTKITAQLLLLGGFLGALALNVAVADPGVPAAAFSGPLVVAATAAFGDASRRLLQQRVGVPPSKRWSLTPTVALLAGLAFVKAPDARWAVAGAAAALFVAGAARSARAMADALDVAVFTIRAPE